MIWGFHVSLVECNSSFPIKPFDQLAKSAPGEALTGRTANVARHASSSKSMPFLPKPENLGGLVGHLAWIVTSGSTPWVEPSPAAILSFLRDY